MEFLILIQASGYRHLNIRITNFTDAVKSWW
jgi:hypothetical protein